MTDSGDADPGAQASSVVADIDPECGPTDQTVLVTGGAGFIGSHLVDALRRRNEVRVLDNLSSGDRERVPADVELIVGDIRDQETVREAAAGVNVIFHEAAQVSVAESMEEPLETHAVNATGTLHVLEAAREADATVVLASSAAVYGDPESVPIDESHPTNPKSPYGQSKLVAEQYAQLYSECYDLETVALRYFNVYGPRQSMEYAGVLTIFLEQARQGEPLTVHGDGTQTRDFVFVGDVVRANLLAATQGDSGAVYNVGTGTSISIRELAELVVEVTDTDSSIKYVEVRSGDIERSQAAINSIQGAIGFKPSVGLTEGLGTYTV